MHCNFFHMLGGAPHVIRPTLQNYKERVNLLHDRVVKGSVVFVGSCGGAIAADADLSFCGKGMDGVGMSLLDDV